MLLEVINQHLWLPGAVFVEFSDSSCLELGQQIRDILTETRQKNIGIHPYE